MRRFNTAILVTGVLVSAPTAHAAHPACALPGSKVILASAHARVYEKALSGVSYQYYACWQKDKRRTYLGVGRGEKGPYAMTLNSTFIAYVHASSATSSTTVVKNLRTHRSVRGIPWTSSIRNAFQDIEVTATGAVVFLYEPSAGTYELRAEDADGLRTLDTGRSIDPTSLALGGRTLYWTSFGVARSVTLK